MTLSVRAFVLLVALTAMLGVSTASALPSHLHADSVPGRCDLCFTAHVAAFETPSVQPLPAPEIAGLATITLPFFNYGPVSAGFFCSRGPPVLFL